MKNIVLCGSMKIKDKIFECGKRLEKYYNVIYPEEIYKDIPKKEASIKHFDKIIDKNNNIVLIVNEYNHGKENYIGPNSLCEIAFGFYFKKKVYLLNDYYEPYMDELKGWGVIPLKGDLNILTKP